MFLYKSPEGQNPPENLINAVQEINDIKIENEEIKNKYKTILEENKNIKNENDNDNNILKIELEQNYSKKRKIINRSRCY